MSQQDVLNLLIGPAGLTVGLVILVGLLVTERVVPARRLKEAQEQAKAALDLATANEAKYERVVAMLEAQNALQQLLVGGTGQPSPRRHRPVTRPPAMTQTTTEGDRDHS